MTSGASHRRLLEQCGKRTHSDAISEPKAAQRPQAAGGVAHQYTERFIHDGMIKFFGQAGA